MVIVGFIELGSHHKMRKRSAIIMAFTRRLNESLFRLGLSPIDRLSWIIRISMIISHHRPRICKKLIHFPASFSVCTVSLASHVVVRTVVECRYVPVPARSLSRPRPLFAQTKRTQSSQRNSSSRYSHPNVYSLIQEIQIRRVS